MLRILTGSKVDTGSQTLFSSTVHQSVRDVLKVPGNNLWTLQSMVPSHISVATVWQTLTLTSVWQQCDRLWPLHQCGNSVTDFDLDISVATVWQTLTLTSVWQQCDILWPWHQCGNSVTDFDLDISVATVWQTLTLTSVWQQCDRLWPWRAPEERVLQIWIWQERLKIPEYKRLGGGTLIGARTSNRRDLLRALSPTLCIFSDTTICTMKLHHRIQVKYKFTCTWVATAKQYTIVLPPASHN